MSGQFGHSYRWNPCESHGKVSECLTGQGNICARLICLPSGMVFLLTKSGIESRRRTSKAKIQQRLRLAGLAGGRAGRSAPRNLAQNGGAKSLERPRQLAGQRMTAEIAVLNKSAVALATDSAITISAGAKEEKIFDSGDKLFELSNHNPIGIMIYNDMQFFEIPLAVIIKDFRDQCPHVDSVNEAVDSFLAYLNNIGNQTSWEIQSYSIRKILTPIAARVHQRFQDKFLKILIDEESKDPPPEIGKRVKNDVLSLFERAFANRPSGQFYGATQQPRFTKKYADLTYSIVKDLCGSIFDDQRDRVVKLFKTILFPTSFPNPERE